MSISTAAPQDLSWLRRFRAPLVAVALPIIAFLLKKACSRADFGPNVEMALPLLMPVSVLVGVIMIAIWFMFFSAVSSGKAILATVGVLIALPFVAMIPIRKIELTGSWSPLIIWRWQGGRFPVKSASVEGQLPEIDLTIGPGDFPRFRGETGDGVVRGVQFTRLPTVERWRRPIGGGYAGFAVAGNVLVTIEQRGDKEAVVCYDQDTGRERWVYDYPALFVRSEPMGGDGPRATPTIYDGDVYSLGATGILAHWTAPPASPAGPPTFSRTPALENVSWGMAGSPLIVDDWVFVYPGINHKQNAKKAVAAYDRETGKPFWQKGDKPAGYSSPVFAELCGSYQLVLFDGGGLAGIDLDSGNELWRYPWTTMYEMNSIQPLILDGDRYLFTISSEQSNGCAWNCRLPETAIAGARRKCGRIAAWDRSSRTRSPMTATSMA